MNDAVQEAVSVFKDGIKNSYIKATLYGIPIKDLEHVYAIARTIAHDKEHRSLNLSYRENGNEQRTTHNYHFQQRYQNQMRPNIKVMQQQLQRTSPQQAPVEPMDTTSANTRQRWINTTYEAIILNGTIKDMDDSVETFNKPKRCGSTIWPQKTI